MALRTLKPMLSDGLPKKPEGWFKNTESAAARGYGHAWRQAVLRIRARDSDLCQQCIRDGGPIGTYAAVDHIVPRAECGSDDDSNLEVICRAHHVAKTARESGRSRRA